MLENGIKWALGVFFCSIYGAKWNVATRAHYASASHDTIRSKVGKETTGNDVDDDVDQSQLWSTDPLWWRGQEA